MAAEWNPQWVVEPDRARALIEARWPELAPAGVEEFGNGWDNTVYLINERLVFRFPRRPIAVPLMHTEIRLLPWLAGRLSLAIPNPSYVGFASPDYPCPFAGYPLLPGRTLPRSGLAPSSRSRLAQSLGRFLRQLHSVDVEAAKSHGVPLDTLRRLDIEARRLRTNDRLSQLAAAGVVADRGSIDRLLDTLPRIDRPAFDTLVHGDLHFNQVLIDDGGELSAVIDWGDVHVGDPAVDFAGVHAILPPAAHQAFLAEYGPVNDRIWQTARGRALWHTVAVLAHAIDVSDADTVSEAQVCLAHLTASDAG